MQECRMQDTVQVLMSDTSKGASGVKAALEISSELSKAIRALGPRGPQGPSLRTSGKGEPFAAVKREKRKVKKKMRQQSRKKK